MFVYRRSREELALAARTTSGTGPIRREGLFRTTRVVYDVTAVAGTNPTLTIRLEAPTRTGGWCTIGSSGALTTVTNGSFLVEGMPDIWRAAYDLAGTDPSFTFTVFTYQLE